MYTYYTYGVLCEREREKGWICELYCNVVHGPLPPKKKIKKIIPPRVNLFSGSSILANIADFIFNVT